MEARPPTLGSAVHYGLAKIILGEPPELLSNHLVKWQEDYLAGRGTLYLSEELDTLVQLREEAEALVLRAIEFINLDQWETEQLNGEPMVEKELIVPLFGWGGYHGFLDWVAIDKNTGARWLIDFKVRKEMIPDESEEVNFQMATYQQLLAYHGLPTVGTINLQIQAKLPKIPKINKDGSVARSDIKTDWPTYRQTVIDSNNDPNDYLDMMEKLLLKEFFRKSLAYRGPQEVQNIWDEIVVPASLDMANQNTQDNLFYRNMNYMNCKMCGMTDYCLEDLRGGDIEFLLKTQYITLAELEKLRATEKLEEELEEEMAEV